MLESIIHPGKFLPDNKEEFDKLEAEGKLLCTQCVDCGCKFTSDNVRTHYGWRETQISALCENCYDKLFAED